MKSLHYNSPAFVSIKVRAFFALPALSINNSRSNTFHVIIYSLSHHSERDLNYRFIVTRRTISFQIASL